MAKGSGSTRSSSPGNRRNSNTKGEILAVSTVNNGGVALAENAAVEHHPRIAQIASERLREIKTKNEEGERSNIGTQFKCGTISIKLSKVFKEETGIKIENRYIYTGAASLFHHRTGVKAEKGKVANIEDIIKMPLNLGKMDVYVYKQSLIFSDGKNKYVLKPNYKVKSENGKIKIVNHISTSVLKDENTLTEKNGYKKIKLTQ